MNKKNLIILLVFLFISAAFVASFKPAPVVVGKFDGFAKCLASKNIKMYGADWCSHCQNEKNAFGSSFKYISYVECPKNPKLCLEAGVENYPTWILDSGEKFIGEQGLLKLAKITDCNLPANETGQSPKTNE